MGRLNRGLDRFETAGDRFHLEVYEAYKSMAEQDPQRWIVVDGVGSIDEVAERVWQSLIGRHPELSERRTSDPGSPEPESGER